MMHGGTVNIVPSWVPQTTQVDIRWDDSKLSDPRPKDNWWGPLAFLGRTFSNEGEWEWDAAAKTLFLWVPVPGAGYSRLVAGLDQFTFPITDGMTGSGSLQPGLIPVTTLILTWQAFTSG